MIWTSEGYVSNDRLGTHLPIPGGPSTANLTRAAILDQLDRILKSPSFRKSQRYTDFLRYCVEAVLDGRADSLKERVIGIDVFGRNQGYDPGTDHVVRSAASEVRKRLAQYYQEFSATGELRLEMQPGSYVPHFAAAVPRTLEPVPTNRRRKYVGRRELFLAVPLAASVLAALGWARWRKHSPLDSFWKPILTSPGPVVVCVGSVRQPSGAALSPNATAGQPQQFSFASTMAVVRISNVLQNRNKPYRVLKASEAGLNDFTGGPSVLIGAYNNPWSLRLMEPLRFHFGTSESERGRICDRADPQQPGWAIRGNPNRDFAVISRVRHARTEQTSMIFGGFTTSGTSAAAEFMTSPEQLRKLAESAPGGWADSNLQVVLSTDLVDGVPGPPKIVALHFW
jgi:hypothetical protein